MSSATGALLANASRTRCLPACRQPSAKASSAVRRPLTRSPATSSVGMPRSITHVRLALPYCFSILARNSFSVVLSEVLPSMVGQWKTIRRDNQRDHDLHAIGTLVAAVAKLPLAIARRIAFEIGTGQIIQQHLEIGLKQIFPALAQEREHRLLVRGELVQTTIQIVRLHERQVLAE